MIAPINAASHPLLGYLVSGFVLMAVGLVVLTARRRVAEPLQSHRGTFRALSYALVYLLITACFARVISPALLGRDQSPWLLALGDVMFVTIGLFAWVMVLAEGHRFTDYGLKGARAGRWGLALAMGLGVVAIYGFAPYQELFEAQVTPGNDSLVFALLFATLGSAIPEELLFRGFLQSTLSGRVRRWARVALPALAFTLARSVRFLPGTDIGGPEWLLYLSGVVLPLGLWWGLMRDLAGGSIWPGLVSHSLLEFGTTLASASPPAP
ncbi:MAG: lysostaphin resistance A-like protein [Acidimicrobiia bacterium]